MFVIYYAAMISHRGLIRIFPSIRYATNINTWHGQNITIGNKIYFTRSIDFFKCEGIKLITHELEHTVQYKNREGVEPMITEYVMKSIGTFLKRGSFQIHDYIDIEAAAIRKSDFLVGCGPLYKKSARVARNTAVDFDGDGKQDGFGLIKKGFVVHYGNGKTVSNEVNPEFDSFMDDQTAWFPGDLNADGFTDLVVIVARGTEAYLHVFYGQGQDGLGYKRPPTPGFYFAKHSGSGVYDARGDWDVVEIVGTRKWVLRHTPRPGMHDPNICSYDWIEQGKGKFRISGNKCKA